MRRYDHGLDADWIARQATITQRLVDSARRTLDRERAEGRLNEPMFDTAVNYAVERVQDGWALGEPVDELRARLDEAAGWAREALDWGMRLDGLEAYRWLETALLSGDSALALEVAGRIPDEIEELDIQVPVARDFLAALARLVERRLEDAERLSIAVAEASSGPRRSLAGAREFAGLGELVGATATRDQAGFDQAVSIRTASVVARYDRSEEGRRHRHGLLDLPGASVAAIARALGLRLPSGHTYLATELAEAR